MDGAGADDDKKPVGWVGVLDDRGGVIAGVNDGGFGIRGLGDFVLKEIGGR